MIFRRESEKKRRRKKIEHHNSVVYFPVCDRHGHRHLRPPVRTFLFQRRELCHNRNVVHPFPHRCRTVKKDDQTGRIQTHTLRHHPQGIYQRAIRRGNPAALNKITGQNRLHLYFISYFRLIFLSSQA